MTESQQSRASFEQQLIEEKEAEIAQLHEQMRQLATEKEWQQQSNEELRRQLETSLGTSTKKEKTSLFGFFSKKRSGDDGSQEKPSTDRIEKPKVMRVSKPKASCALIFT